MPTGRSSRAAAIRLAGTRLDGDLDLHVSRLVTALDNMSQGLCMFDAEGRLVIANRRFSEMYGFPPGMVKPGKTLREMLEAQVAIGIYSGSDPRAYIESRLKMAPGDELRTLADGRVIAISRRTTAEGGWVTTHEDVTERRRAEARVAHLAHHDALTDLPNRVLFRERMLDAFAHVRHGGSFAVLSLDLDHFKTVNDTLGHPVGDALLQEVARRLQGCIRGSDTAARLGGDEFAILQVGIDQPQDAGALAKRLIEIVGQPYDLDGHHVVVGTCVGIALAPNDGVTADQLLKGADMALYRAKADGRGTFRYFEAEMNARARARRTLEIDLRRALAAGEFKLFYQPLVNLRSNRICGFEALLRWRHPERGLVSPDEFVPLAEEIGLIVPLGDWVIRQACTEAATWPEDVSVAVNLSPAQFKSRNLVPTVVGALASAGLAASRLELEITESVLLQNDRENLAMLRQVRDLGARIVMDDFGTGYSSLSYLRSFPFDKIKIDRSFVQGLDDASCAAIVCAATGLGRSLGMRTTAEGVETREQLEYLTAQGCTEAQGYYFSVPRPLPGVQELLKAQVDRSPCTGSR